MCPTVASACGCRLRCCLFLLFVSVCFRWSPVSREPQTFYCNRVLHETLVFWWISAREAVIICDVRKRKISTRWQIMKNSVKYGCICSLPRRTAHKYQLIKLWWQICESHHWIHTFTTFVFPAFHLSSNRITFLALVLDITSQSNTVCILLKNHKPHSTDIYTRVCSSVFYMVSSSFSHVGNIKRSCSCELAPFCVCVVR